MKPLPVIQLPPRNPTAVPSENRPLQTAGMENDPEKSRALRPEIVKALSTVFDPEIPVNIFELGLIYDLVIDSASNVGVRMTLTAPACPAAQFLPEKVRSVVAGVPGVSAVKVDLVWDPPWTRDRMSDSAKLQLGMF